MNKLIPLIENISHVDRELAKAITEAYIALHPEIQLEAKGDIRRFLAALGVAGGLAMGGNYVAEKRADNAEKAISTAIKELTAADKAGNYKLKDEKYSMLKQAGAIYHIDVDPSNGERIFVTPLGTFDSNGEKLQ